MRTAAAFLIILISLVLPAASAVVPADARQTWPIVASPELNVTGGANITYHTIPSRYEMSPTPINVKVEISDTSLPGPKGEMAAGPRSIGFSADPLSLAILVIAIVAGAAGTWYIARRKPEEPGEEDK
jgi:hypothetical protein